MWRTTLRTLLANRGRLALTALAIVLAVGFMAATFGLSAGIRAGADDAFAATGTATDLRVRSVPLGDDGPYATREPIDESLVATVADVEGVAAAVGYVEGYAQLVVDGETVDGEPVGASADGIGSVSPFTVADGRAPRGPDEVAVDGATARAEDLAVGDDVTVLVPGGPRAASVAGIVRLGDSDDRTGTAYALFDLPTAQQLLDREGRIDAVLVGAEEDITRAELAARIRRVVPDGVEVVDARVVAGEQAERAGAAAGAVDRLLGGFAVIALIVGAYLIVNTFTIVVAQRTRELALLRAVGASRRQVARSVVAEALVTGLVASVVGVVLGVGVAIGIRALSGAAGLDLPGEGVRLTPQAAGLSIVIGTVLTVLASWLPARRAARIPPVAALRDVVVDTSTSRRRIVAGAIITGLALLTGILGVPLAIVGVTLVAPVIVPRLARLVGWPGARLGVAGRLGRDNAARHPTRTASTASALMIGLVAVGAISILASSMLATFETAIDDVVEADLIADAGQAPFPAAAGAALADVPEVADVAPERYGEFRLVDADPDRYPQESGLQTAIGVEPTTFGEVIDLGVVEGSVRDLADGGVLLSEEVANRHDWGVGDTVAMEFARTGVQRIPVEGIYREDSLYGEAYVLSLREFEANITGDLIVRVLANAAPGVEVADAQEAAAAALRPFAGVSVHDRAGYLDEVTGTVDVILAVVVVLLGMAIGIAVLGIVNTLALSIHERSREIGLLRAVGMTRQQLRAMVRWESISIAVIGGLLGLVVGTHAGTVLARSIGEIDTVAVPVARLLLFLVFAVIAGVAAAVVPARRAARTDVLAAIRG